ncbi:MAG: histidine phosphatase family protein [Spirochaeta sp.]|nr:histidine phosphatase family protein [Spirochaeta sp.]
MRHGESEANLDGRMQGRTESPLTHCGRTQATRAGAFFRGRGITKLFSSPLGRARETAALVRLGGELPEPETFTDLQELDLGIFSNLRYAELATLHPREFLAFQAKSWAAVPNAEPNALLSDRAGRVWTHLIEVANAGHTDILSVSHGGFLQWIIKATFGNDNEDWMPMVEAQNCGIFIFEARPVDAAEPGEEPAYYGIWRRMNYQVPDQVPE